MLPRLVRVRLVTLRKSAVICVVVTLYLFIQLLFYEPNPVHGVDTKMSMNRNTFKARSLEDENYHANQVLAPSNVTPVSNQDPYVEKNTKVVPRGTPDENDALYVARLVTEFSLSRRTGYESFTQRLVHFKPAMTFDERKILMDITRRLDYIATRWNITYFLYGGALLGSFRHHDLIPWDDDLDVLVDIKQRYNLFRAISAYSEFDAFIAGPRMKVWSRQSSRKLSKYPWGWPYVDISFYQENDTHIWDSADEYRDTCVYPKSIVFPLHKRPLAGYFFNAPRDSYANLKLTYTSADCSTHYYSHKYEKKVKRNRRYSIPCDILSSAVPFVHRSRHKNGIAEVLKLGQSVLTTVIVDEPRYVITNPFNLEIQSLTD